MHVLHTILEIKHIELYRVICLWNTGELRENNFIKYINGNNRRLHDLADKSSFLDVKVVDGALQWSSIQVSGLCRGEVVDQPLTLDSEVLYDESEFIGTSLMTVLSFKLRQARLESGMTQSKLALLSGTTKEYISRIESGKADFQISTYDRIIQKGLGKQAEVVFK